MPSLLDRLLNTRVNERKFARQNAVDAFNSQSVTAMGDRGIQFSVPDNRASTQLAQGVARRLLGHTPQSMLTRAGPDTTVLFREDGNTASQLREAGIGVGSSLSDVQEAMRALTAQNNDRGATNAPVLSLQDGTRVTTPTRRPNAQSGSPIDGGVTQSNPSQVSMNEGFNNGFQNGQDQNEQDFLQLNLHVNKANEDFTRLLHSSLFAN